MRGEQAVKSGIAAKLQLANGHVNTRKVAHGCMASEGRPPSGLKHSGLR